MTRYKNKLIYIGTLLLNMQPNLQLQVRHPYTFMSFKYSTSTINQLCLGIPDCQYSYVCPEHLF